MVCAGTPVIVRGPLGRLRRAVVRAEHVGAETLETGAVAREERGIVPLFRDQHPGEREHQRGIGVGADGDPGRIEEIGAVAPRGADDDEFAAGGFRLAQPFLHRVLAGAAARNLTVLEREAAEGDEQLAVSCDAFPVRDSARHRREGADDVRQEKLRAAPAVVADLVDTAAAGEQKAADQGARMMQPPRRGPAVRAAEDSFSAAFGAHAREFAGDEIERPLPGDFDEGLDAALRARVIAAAAAALFQPAFAHGRLLDAHRRIHHLGHRGEHRRGVRIARERLAAHEAAVLDHGGERAPVSERRKALRGHGLSIAVVTIIIYKTEVSQSH